MYTLFTFVDRSSTPMAASRLIGTVAETGIGQFQKTLCGRNVSSRERGTRRMAYKKQEKLPDLCPENFKP